MALALTGWKRVGLRRKLSSVPLLSAERKLKKKKKQRENQARFPNRKLLGLSTDCLYYLQHQRSNVKTIKIINTTYQQGRDIPPLEEHTYDVEGLAEALVLALALPFSFPFAYPFPFPAGCMVSDRTVDAIRFDGKRIPPFGVIAFGLVESRPERNRTEPKHTTPNLMIIPAI